MMTAAQYAPLQNCQSERYTKDLGCVFMVHGMRARPIGGEGEELRALITGIAELTTATQRQRQREMQT